MASILKRFSVRNGIDNNSKSIINVADPSSPQDAATKNFASNASNISSGVLGVANGGTGQTTAPGALNALLPSQTGNNGKVLTTDGSSTSWATASSSAITSAVLTGNVTTAALVVTNAIESGKTIAAAPESLQYIFLSEGSATYFTVNATNNWATNIGFGIVTPLNNIMSVGQIVTAVVISTQGATPYYHNTLLIDGSVVTPMWAGGSAPTSGHANSIDVYTFTIIKTGNATFKVLASQSQYK